MTPNVDCGQSSPISGMISLHYCFILRLIYTNHLHGKTKVIHSHLAGFGYVLEKKYKHGKDFNAKNASQDGI